MADKDTSKTKAQLVEELSAMRRRLARLESVSAPDAPPSAPATTAAPAFSREGVSILVVDDSSVVRKSIKRDLNAAGYQVVTAGSGREALTRLGPEISAVLLDLHLPGMNGLEVLQQIHQVRPGLPVIMLTAAVDLESRIGSFTAGADDYLLKPYHQTELLARLDRLVRLQLAHSALQAEAEHRAQAQEGLRETEGKLRFVMDKAGAMIAIMDRNANYIYLNPSHRRLGFEPEELLGRSGFGLVHPDDRQRLVEELARGQEREINDLKLSYRLVDRNGEIHYVRSRFDAIRDREGRLENIIAMAEDLTREQWLEESLLKSEERWQFALEGAGDGVWDWDVTTNQVFFSRQWKAMLGFNEEEIVDHLDEWKTRVQSDDLAGTMQEIERHFVGETPVYASEHRVRCKDGSFKWVLDRGKVMQRGPDGRPLRMIGTHTDISARKRMEEELRESRQMLATLIDNLPGFIYRCRNDREWTMSYLSIGCQAITGYYPEDFIANRTIPYNDLVRADHQETLWEHIQGRLEKREVFQVEYPIVTRNGEERWVWEQGRGVFAPDGRLLYLEGFITDVTNRKQAEDALRASEERLRQMFDAHASVKYLIDPESGHIIFANQAAADFYGYPLEELQGMHISRINIHPYDEIKQEMELARKVEKSLFTFRHRLASGAIRDVEIYASPVQIQGQTLLFSIVHDITERKWAEEAIKTQRDLSIALGSINEVQPALKLTLAAAVKVAGMDSGAVYLRNLESDGIDLSHHQGLSPEFVSSVARFEPGSVNFVLTLDGRPIYSTYEGAGIPLDHTKKAEGLRAMAMLPIVDEGNVIGCLVVSSHTEEKVPEHARGALEIIVSQIGRVIARVQSERALRESEERFRVASASANDLIYEWRVSTNRVQWYGDIDGLLGFAPGGVPRDLAGFQMLIHPEDRERVFATLAEHMRTGKSYRQEYRIRAASGEYRVFSSSGTFIKSPSDRPQKWIGAITDVTENKRAEAALREALARLAATMDALPDLMFEVDGEGVIHDFRAPNPKMLLAPPDQFLGRDFISVLPPAASRIVSEALAEAVRTGRHSGAIYQLDISGDPRWYELSISKKQGQGEGAPHFIALVRDITARKRIEEQTRLQAMVLNQIQDLVTITDLTGRITYVNEAECRMMGRTTEELLGQNVAAYGEDPEVVTQDSIIRETLEKGEWRGDVVNITADGRTITLDCRTQLIRDEAGTPVALCGISTDITERKRAEQELKDSEHRQADIINFLPVPTFVIDREGRVRAWNRALEKMTGVKADRILGHGNHEYSLAFYGERRPIFIDLVNRPREEIGDRYRDVYKSEEIVVGETFLPALGEDGLHVMVYASELRDSQGRPVGGIESIMDITERKRAEEFNQVQRDLGLALSSTTELKDALYLCFNAAIKVSGMDSGGVYLRHPESGAMELVFHQGLTPEFVSRISHLAPDHPNTQLVMQGRSIFSSHQRIGVMDEVRARESLRALAVLPIRNEGQIIGCLNIASHHQYDVPLSVRPLLEILVAQIGGVIAHARAQQALKESEAKYRELVENANSIILRLDTEARVTFINEFAQEFFGYRPEEIIGRSVIGTIVPEQESSGRDLAELLNNIVNNPEPYKNNENENMRKNGERVWISWTNKAMLDEHGRFIEVLCIGNDATERKRAEEALRESEKRFRELVDASPDSIMVVQNERFVFANPASLRMLGYEAKELLEIEALSIFDAETAKIVRRRLRRTERKHLNRPAEFDVIRKDGVRVPVESISVPIQYNQRPAAMAIMTDITDRKQVVNERLKTERLESIGVLAGGIAHDFNNILMGITGNIALAKMEVNAGDDPSASLLESEKAADRARDLTRQLLTFSRGGKPIIRLESVRDIIAEAVGFVRHGANVRCDLTLAADLYPALVDAGQISQVIHNLVINAIQAMPEGGNVIVAAENIELDETNPIGLPAGPYLLISVADKGHGIPGENLSRIFDPYFTTKERGSGLGLASAYSIITRHQGKITVESEVGKGSVFRVYLPAAEGEMVEKTTLDLSTIKGSGQVLIMDDETGVRRVARRMLERMGYSVVEAENGEQAIELFQQAMAGNDPFVLLIFDLTVPGGMGGKEAIRRILELDPSVKAIVASGYSEDPVMANFAEFGFSGMVAKPYKFDELNQVLTGILGQARDKANPDPEPSNP